MPYGIRRETLRRKRSAMTWHKMCWICYLSRMIVLIVSGPPPVRVRIAPALHRPDFLRHTACKGFVIQHRSSTAACVVPYIRAGQYSRKSVMWLQLLKLCNRFQSSSRQPWLASLIVLCCILGSTTSWHPTKGVCVFTTNSLQTS